MLDGIVDYWLLLLLLLLTAGGEGGGEGEGEGSGDVVEFGKVEKKVGPWLGFMGIGLWVMIGIRVGIWVGLRR